MKKILLLLFITKASLAQMVEGLPIVTFNVRPTSETYYYASLNYSKPKSLGAIPYLKNLIDASKLAKNATDFQNLCIDYKPSEIPNLIKRNNLAIQNAYLKKTEATNESFIIWHLVDTLSNETFTIKTIKNDKGKLYYTSQTIDENTIWLFENLKPDVFHAIATYYPKKFPYKDLKYDVNLCYYDFGDIAIYSPCLSQYFRSIKKDKNFSWVFR